jgi:hypothetical protein
VARVHVTPEEFTLVEYDAGVIAGLAEELAGAVGLPDGIEIELEVDEELPLPLVGSTADVVGARAVLWFSGANFEHTHHRAQLDRVLARTELAMSLLRAADRLTPGFEGAPADEALTDAQRQAWDSWAEGRVARLGEHSRKVRRQYHFRLYNGFTDVADAAFDRLWSADALTWSDIEAICAECAASDPRPAPKKKGSIRRETLKASSDG